MCAVYNNLKKMNNRLEISLRELLIYLTIILAIIIVIFTEVLSIFKIINREYILFLWSLIFIFFFIIFFFIKKKIYKNFKKIKLKIINFELIFIFIIFFLTFITSLIYPPNTYDAMSYHMPRVMHWMQNNNVNFYPTNDLRELVMGPLSQFIILHFYLIVDGDYFSNLVQWYAMITSCLVASLIAREFGCNYRYQIFSAFFCATIPMGILQSTSTQTDYITTMWLVIMVYSILKYINSNLKKYIFIFSISLALGVLTKGTIYIFALPFCIWLTLYIIIIKRQHFKYLLIVPLVVFFLNFGHFSRNVGLYQNPLGLSQESNIWTNKKLDITTFVSNFLRNSALNVSLPSHIVNSNNIKIINLLHDYMNISSRDPETTISGRFNLHFSLDETHASSPIHFFISLCIIFLIICKKILKKNEKCYSISIIAGYILFCILIKWSLSNNRYFLSLLILSGPLVSYFLYKFKLRKITFIISILFCFYALPYLTSNNIRPLFFEFKWDDKNFIVAKPDFLTKTRNELYYMNIKNESYYEWHSEISKKIANVSCNQIGFDSPDLNGVIYPLWHIIKKDLHPAYPKILNLNVKNKSKIYYKNYLEDNKKCAIINFEDYTKKITLNLF